METESVAKRAIALITERGAMRSDQIAEELGVRPAVIASSLGGHVINGALVACKVERPEGMAVNEYRISAAGKTSGFREFKVKEDKSKKTPPVPVPAAVAAKAPAKPKRAYKRRAPAGKSQRNTAISAKRPRVVRNAPKLRKARADLRTQHAELRPKNADAGRQFSAFRAALASDGAMIFLDAAAGQFELTRTESRALIDFVRTLDRGEVGA